MPDADWVRYKQIRGKPLPEKVQLLGTAYALQKTLKRDFYAATGVYQRRAAAPAAPEQVILKVYHTGPLGFVRLRWLGRLLCRREVRYLQTLDAIPGIPRFLERYRSTGFVREYVPGCNLREFATTALPDERFFVRLREILDAVHARGVAHNDLSKPENVLVRSDGSPVLIDFQIAVKIDWTDRPLIGRLGRRILGYLQSVDRYHLSKQHRRCRPWDFSAEEHQASRRKGVLLTVHGWLRRPYRAIRHFVLRKFLTTKSDERR